MSLSKWQKLSDRMTEKVVPTAAVTARDDAGATARVVAESSALSLITIG